MAASVQEPVGALAERSAGGREEGIALAVSGGGYRAMLFHLGAFLRLFELGVLQQLKRVSSVSGGSITAAKIGLEWGKLDSRQDFSEHVIDPIRALASTTIDVPSVLWGLVMPGGVANQVARRYRRHLFGSATLQDLPDSISFVINATNLATGAYWRFSKRVMADYLVGTVPQPRISLADAVAASSAFTPALSPFVLDVSVDQFGFVAPEVERHMLEKVLLTDGGVYDNLGLETVWQRYQTLLVSDASASLARAVRPRGDWLRLGLRAVDVIYSMMADLRRRLVIDAFRAGERSGAYWGIGSNIAAYGLDDVLPCPIERTRLLAATPTRLAKLCPRHQERLINWGYAACDAAMRRHQLPAEPPPPHFPYPAAGV